MLSAEAIARIKFVTKSEIQEFINKDQLWEHMGGTVSAKIRSVLTVEKVAVMIL